jgi:8-oxo-dGTP pyrophosphatase MutT (NUDIX family)
MRLSALLARRADLVTLGVQGAIIDENRRVLLVRHGYRPGWHFPGGGVERGEKVELALVREVGEETGIVVSGPVRLYGIYTNFDYYPGDHVVLFVADKWRRERVPTPNAEIAEIGFFALDQLPQDLAPATARRIAEIFGGKAQSAEW